MTRVRDALARQTIDAELAAGIRHQRYVGALALLYAGKAHNAYLAGDRMVARRNLELARHASEAAAGGPHSPGVAVRARLARAVALGIPTHLVETPR